jgi:hypothetical protein
VIYFLVNHKYHYEDAVLHFPDTKDIGLISVPHSHIPLDECIFDTVYEFCSPWTSKKWLLGVPILLTCARIKQTIRPKKNDVLVLYSEYEPLNHVIVEMFKKVNAMICVIEDGIPSYIQNANRNSDPLTLKQIIHQKLTRFLAGIRRYEIRNIEGVRHARIPDEYIDFVIYYRPMPMHRRITQFIAQYPKQVVEKDSGAAIFLNQPIYEVYVGFDEYKDYLTLAIGALSAFEKVYFKFHPREEDKVKSEIKVILEKGKKNIIFLESNDGIDDLTWKYKPTVAVSFFSSALMSLQLQGVEPVFLYRMLNMKEIGPLKHLTHMLTELNYKFPNTKTDINKNYESRIPNSKHGKSVSELLTKIN